jgi:hypothetical protein
MIKYEYLCERCGVFEIDRPMGLRKHPGPCPTCGKLSPRAYSIPNFSKIDPAKKEAIERNFKAQFEPEICGEGCQHEEHTKTPSQKKVEPKYKTYTGPRPWVIEHAK